MTHVLHADKWRIMFVFDMLQIPSGSSQICSTCSATSCNPWLRASLQDQSFTGFCAVYFDFLTLRKNTLYSFETSVTIYQPTQRNITEGIN